MMNNLKASFSAKQQETSEASQTASDWAEGSLSVELGKKDSAIWGTLENMMGEVGKAQEQMKGKSKEEKEQLEKSLESELNSKADTLKAVTDKTQKVQETRNAEYLLGLLNQHRDWSVEKQLNATRSFANTSEVARDLLQQYNKSEPLVAQLAELMDARAAQN